MLYPSVSPTSRLLYTTQHWWLEPLLWPRLKPCQPSQPIGAGQCFEFSTMICSLSTRVSALFFLFSISTFTCLFTSDHSSNIIHRVDEVFRCFFLDSVGRTRETRTQVFFVNENFIALLPAWKMSNSYHRCRRSIHQYSLAVVLHERPGALEFSRRAMIWRGAQLAGQPVQRPCAGGAVGWTYGSWESRGLSFVTAALDECATGTLRSTLCVCVCVCVWPYALLSSHSLSTREIAAAARQAVSTLLESPTQVIVTLVNDAIWQISVNYIPSSGP